MPGPPASLRHPTVHGPSEAYEVGAEVNPALQRARPHGGFGLAVLRGVAGAGVAAGSADRSAVVRIRNLTPPSWSALAASCRRAAQLDVRRLA